MAHLWGWMEVSGGTDRILSLTKATKIKHLAGTVSTVADKEINPADPLSRQVMSQGKQATVSGFLMQLSERKGESKPGSQMSFRDLCEAETTWTHLALSWSNVRDKWI